MNARGNESSIIRLTSETADYVLDKEHRERLHVQGAQERTLRLVREARQRQRQCNAQGRHEGRRWLKIALFALLAALLLTPVSAVQAQAPWQMDDDSDSGHPALVEYRMGLFHLVREEYELAIGRFDEAIRLLPDYAAAYEARAYCYEALGDLERAEADYVQAIHLTPAYGPTYKLLADLYYEQGEHALALENYRMYVSLTDEGVDGGAVERAAELEADLS